MTRDKALSDPLVAAAVELLGAVLVDVREAAPEAPRPSCMRCRAASLLELCWRCLARVPGPERRALRAARGKPGHQAALRQALDAIDAPPKPQAAVSAPIPMSAAMIRAMARMGAR